MLFQTLKSLLMIIPQSTCYSVLRDRLVSTSRFRQSVIANRSLLSSGDGEAVVSKETEMFVDRVLDVRELHCHAMWDIIRAGSLERFSPAVDRRPPEDPPGREEGTATDREEGADRIEWLGYGSKEEEQIAQARYREEKRRRQTGFSIEEVRSGYNDFDTLTTDGGEIKSYVLNKEKDEEEAWKDFWVHPNQ